jgi:hypothetical protein
VLLEHPKLLLSHASPAANQLRCNRDKTVTRNSNWTFVAWRIVRPDLAPKGFVEAVGAAIGCKPDCRGR